MWGKIWRNPFPARSLPAFPALPGTAARCPARPQRWGVWGKRPGRCPFVPGNGAWLPQRGNWSPALAGRSRPFPFPPPVPGQRPLAVPARSPAAGGSDRTVSEVPLPHRGGSLRWNRLDIGCPVAQSTMLILRVTSWESLGKRCCMLSKMANRRFSVSVHCFSVWRCCRALYPCPKNSSERITSAAQSKSAGAVLAALAADLPALPANAARRCFSVGRKKRCSASTSPHWTHAEK